MKTLQVRMANLYIHQMKRGGIIDSNGDESNVISIQSEDVREEVIIVILSISLSFIENFNLIFLLQQPRKSKKSSNKPQPTEQQLNQARQAAALALRNATMVKNDDEEEEDDEENDRRRHHGRRGGNRHKNAPHKRNGHHHNHRGAQTAKISGVQPNNDAEQASGSTNSTKR